MAFRAAAVLFALATCGDAIRQSRRKSSTNSSSEGPPGQVHMLYTFGAPKVSLPALRNPLTPNGCFPGVRVVNKYSRLLLSDKVDIVPTLLGQVTDYSHILIDVQFLDQNDKATFHNCGWVGSDLETVDVPLHFDFVYMRRAKKQPNLEEVGKIGLDHSYNNDVRDVASKIGAYGWNLASAVVGREVVHLMQNPRNFDCILTFGGSDTLEDWVKDVIIVPTNFCGLQQRVHLGFKLEYLQMVRDSAFQRHVRPQLGSCSKLNVLGHSLGGAVAALFTACAHNRPAPGSDGYDDFQHIEWSQGRAQLLPAIGLD